MTPGGVEKRRDKRLQLTLPVKFSTEQKETLSLRTGVTHNVSSGGVYFEVPVGHAPASGALRVRIGVPGRHGEEKPNLTLVGSGLVRRVEKLSPERIVGSWPESQKQQGICGVAFQFEQRPTIQLHSIEELLWEDHTH